MKIFSNAVLVTSLVLGLSACSSISLNPFSDSGALKPAPLAEFKPSLGVAVLWKKNVSPVDTDSFQPVVSDDVLYVADGKGMLRALDAASGAVRWEAKQDKGFTAGVGVTADTVAAVSAGNELYAFNFEGKAKWNITLPSDSVTPPLGVAGLIVVRTIDYAVSAYSSESGALMWRYQRQLPSLTLRNSSPVAFNNGRVYAGYPGGRVVGIDVNNGALVWEGSLGNTSGTTEIERISDVTGAPQYNFREVCAASFQGNVGCLDSTTGRLIWSQPMSAPSGASVDDRYLIAANELGDMLAFARGTGNQTWRIDTFQRRIPTTPTVAGRAVVVGDFEGYLHFIDRDTGKTLNRIKFGSKGLSSPAVAFGESNLVVQSKSGELAVLAVN